MTTQEIQKEVIANWLRRGGASAYDFNGTILGLAEELGKLVNAHRHDKKKLMLNALADIGVYMYGGFEILGANAHAEISKVVKNNKRRTGQKDHKCHKVLVGVNEGPYR